jgi:type II secretory pathway pseudopilin PulG
MSSARRKRPGRTLLELLVALAIILLLMSVLLPAAFSLMRAAQRLAG